MDIVDDDEPSPDYVEYEGEVYVDDDQALTESKVRGGFKALYHKAPVSCRKSILKNGLRPSVGDSYKAHWEEVEELSPYVFLYDIGGGEYDSTYDDDIWRVDMSYIDQKRLRKDPEKALKNSYIYDGIIPPEALKLVYRGSTKDAGDLRKHKDIYDKI